MKPSYFVVKSNPKWGNDLPVEMEPGVIWTWVTGAKNFGEWHEHDRVFLWEGSPANYIIGLGVIRNPLTGYDSDGKKNYLMEFLTRALEPNINKKRLLANPVTADASFLKKGNANGVVPLRDDDAEAIYKMICHLEPGAASIWPDLVSVASPVEDKEPEFLINNEELEEDELLIEGSTIEITVNAHERNCRARNLCIAHYGVNCSVCEMTFEEAYGEHFEGIIHVHHLTPISEISEEYTVDPIEDLRPVCPNCHAALHSKNPPYTIQELRDEMAKTKSESGRNGIEHAPPRSRQDRRPDKNP